MQHIHLHDFCTPGAQQAHTAAHLTECVEAELVEGAPYSGKEMADELEISESTFKTLWLPWLQGWLRLSC